MDTHTARQSKSCCQAVEFCWKIKRTDHVFHESTERWQPFTATQLAKLNQTPAFDAIIQVITQKAAIAIDHAWAEPSHK